MYSLFCHRLHTQIQSFVVSCCVVNSQRQKHSRLDLFKSHRTHRWIVKLSQPPSRAPAPARASRVCVRISALFRHLGATRAVRGIYNAHAHTHTHDHKTKKETTPSARRTPTPTHNKPAPPIRPPRSMVRWGGRSLARSLASAGRQVCGGVAGCCCGRWRPR